MIMKQYEKEHLALVLDNGAECTVLLKTNGDFPIKKAEKIAAFGAGMRYTIKGGTGSGEVNSRFTHTIEQGLEKAGFKITSKSWLDAYDAIRVQAKKDFIKQLKAESRKKHENVVMYSMGKSMTEPYHELTLEGAGDTAIYVVSRMSGEGSDRAAVEGEVKLARAEIRDILALNKSYKRFMLVLNVGGVVDLSPIMEVNNILLLSQLGVDNGRVLSDILLGKQNPSGKLTTTWAAWENYCKEGTFGDRDDNQYKEGIYVGYRYFDTFHKKALFPFGYGLSYTKFEQKTVEVSAHSDEITVKVRVHNIGSMAGKEVVQIYVSMPQGKLDKPYQDLVGFTKTTLLKPSDEEEVGVTFRLSDFASYDEEQEGYLLEVGDYIVRVGNSSVSTSVVAILTLDKTIMTLKAKNCLGNPDFTDMKSQKDKKEKIPSDVVRISLSADSIAQKKVTYDKTYEIDERVKSLSDEELVYLQIGNFIKRNTPSSVIGNAAQHVAGAAGETTSALTGKGIKNLIMADGPAGLRLAKEFYEDDKGVHIANGEGAIPTSVLEYMGPIVKFIALMITGGKKSPKGAVVKEQAATMIPVGTAIAQSFNYELAKSFGDIVGSEMKMFGVNLWLAPALNIHRSIQCGRNFEYYSEDPLVSGLMAAAITEGVQAYKGCATTLKHYAANNAETNRYCNNSLVSERAMREIYLRGFGLCVKKTQPHAVMTSYNLLNGTHTAEHSGLIEEVLRREFGFQGIVMTDWIIAIMTIKKTKYRNSLSDEVAKAGGDIFMPGGKGDYKRVLRALKKGELSREQLEINATRMIRMIDQLA
jgi:beta-glucosidase